MNRKPSLILPVVAVVVCGYVGVYYATVTPMSNTHDQTSDELLHMITVDPTYPIFQPRRGFHRPWPYLVFAPIHGIDRSVRPSVWPDPVPTPKVKF